MKVFYRLTTEIAISPSLFRIGIKISDCFDQEFLFHSHRYKPAYYSGLKYRYLPVMTCHIIYFFCKLMLGWEALQLSSLLIYYWVQYFLKSIFSIFRLFLYIFLQEKSFYWLNKVCVNHTWMPSYPVSLYTLHFWLLY